MQSNMPIKVQVRKTLATAAYADASRVVTFSGSETTAGLAPAMPVSGTGGIPVGTTITSVDSSTTITLSANPTGGTLTGQTLIFEDLTRITHIGGYDDLSAANAFTQTMLSLATGSGGPDTLLSVRRYVGSNSTRSITGVGFKPDMVWSAARSAAEHRVITDSMRGVGSSLYTDGTNAEFTTDSFITSFDPDGFSLLANDGPMNRNEHSIVAWCWKAGGVPSANNKRKTDGSASETTLAAGGGSPNADQWTTTNGLQYMKQSVNSAGGFSITQYESNAVVPNDSHTIKIPHGLGATPNLVMIKSYTDALAWSVWHSNLVSTTQGNLQLNTDVNPANHATMWGNIGPTADHITLGYRGETNYNDRNYMMYCWKAVAGLSAFGAYEGTGTNGFTSANIGFRPKLLMFKNIDATGTWPMYTDTLYPSGENINNVWADITLVESAYTNYGVTVTSTGWTFDSGSSATAINTIGETYIYMAWA
jgi:hypothetical protein